MEFASLIVTLVGFTFLIVGGLAFIALFLVGFRGGTGSAGVLFFTALVGVGVGLFLLEYQGIRPLGRPIFS